MNLFLQRTIPLCLLCFIAFLSQAQTTNTYTSSTTWTVPATVNTITIKVYGGAGGLGGMDCGAGCTNAAGGPAGYVLATYSVTPGNVVGIYPGNKGTNGSTNATGSGGGTGGVATYNVAYNGGTGGNAGSAGASGGGGGGGAASVVTINSTIKIVAGGAGGGGGMANLANSGSPGSSSASANGTSNTGGNGTMPGGDGGGGGGGGGGQYGSVGGAVHAAGTENAGDGGFIGGNSVSGASSVTNNSNIAWTSTGQIEITFLSTLPATWLSFTAAKQGNGVVLNWSTATEQNTRYYTVQQSNNGISWNNIGLVQAAGNSTTEQRYKFSDQNPVNGNNYYRLLQQDADGRINYSKVIVFNIRDAVLIQKIYPNPVVNGTMTVSLKQLSTVQIYNSTGVEVIQQRLTAGEHLLDLSSLSKGIYYIKVIDEAVLFVIQ